MIIYLLKFSACLAIFMVFYKLLLERSSVHKFKRFYLLGALVLALLIPSLTIIEYIEPVIVEEFSSFVVTDFDMAEITPEVIEIDYTPIILWSLYGLGVFILLLKFCFNLNTIISRIKSNPKLKSESFINVLVSNLKIPHTFFNYIFFNKHEFELGEIPKEVLLHEQTHAKQKHSIDVLILELLQIIFWFNPLIYLLKRDVKLNHEYLADQAVLQNGIEPSTYQTILLAFSSNAQQQELANAINYSSIKKRFTVMNTHTSKKSIWLKGILLLPLLAILFYSFTEREQVIKEITSPDIIELYLNENKELLLEDEIITFDELEELFKENSKLKVSIKIYPDADVDIARNLTSKLREIGIKKMTVCTSRVAEFKNNLQTEATAEQLSEYNKLAKKYNEQPQDKRIIQRKEVERLEYLYKIMSEEQKKNAQPFPDCPPPPPPAPPQMDTIYTYNRLAKRIQTVSTNRKANIIYLKDIYNRMDTNQKNKVKSPKEVLQIVYKIDVTWILLNSKGQFLVNDVFGSLESVEAEFKNISNAKTKSKEIVFKYEEEAPKEIVDKVNLLIKKYNLENIIDTLPPPPPPPTTPTKKGNGPNGSEYYPIPPPIPENATPEQRVKMQATIDEFEEKYNRKVYQINSDSGAIYSMIVDDQEYDPSQQKGNEVKSGFIKIYGTPHYFVTINDFTKYYNRQGFEVSKSGSKISKNQINASNVVPGQYITKVYSDGKIVAEFYDNKPKAHKDIVDISPPPAPKSSLDFVIDLAKKNATFFFENKKITSDKAIKLIKNNKEFNIQATKTESKQPQVFISKEPINTNRGKSKTPVTVNGKTSKDNQYTLSSKKMQKLELTLNDAQVISFKVKFEGKPTQSIKGNELNKTVKSLVKQAKEGTQVQLYDIKDNDGYTHPPVIITITDKLVGVMGKKN